MQVPASAALPALEEVDGMASELASVAAMLDADSAIEAAAAAVRTRTGLGVGFVGTTDEDGRALRLRRVAGGRSGSLPGLEVPIGTGLGGWVLASARPHRVVDYTADRTITHEHDVPISREGLRSVAAVPIQRSGRVLGILYGADRQARPISDAETAALEEVARSTGLLLEAAARVRHVAEEAVAQERQRLAGALHDSVGALLFAITAGASDLAQQVAGIPDAAARAQSLVDRAAAATAALRRSLVGLQDRPRQVALGAGLAAEAEAFAERTGIPARAVVLTELPDLPDPALGAVLAAVREALHNAEKHACASSVVVTAARSGDGVAIAVTDDGRGLPATGVPVEGPTGLGIAEHAVRLARLGGDLRVLGNDEGGVTVRLRVPA